MNSDKGDIGGRDVLTICMGVLSVTGARACKRPIGNRSGNALRCPTKPDRFWETTRNALYQGSKTNALRRAFWCVLGHVCIINLMLAIVFDRNPPLGTVCAYIELHRFFLTFTAGDKA